jgi:biopolymer transport protein ExbD
MSGMKRQLTTVVLALVLVATIIFRIFPHKHSQGLSVGVVIARCADDENPNMSVEDVHLKPIRLRIEDDGSFSILSIHNEGETVTAGLLPKRLAEIYETRSKRTLFFDAGNSVSYQQVIDGIAAAQGAVPRLRVRLITATTRRDCETGGIIRRIY